MLFKRGQKIYLVIPRIKFKAFFTVAFCIDDLFLLLNKYLYICVLIPFFIPIKTRPTGFCFVPPLGPAIPVIATLMLAFDILDKLLTIARQHS